MNKETKKVLGTLELLLESCRCINIPGHEDGGYIYPFVWEESKQSRFNTFYFSLTQGWLKLTDTNVVRHNWQEMKYVISFERFNLNTEELKHKSTIVTDLFQLLKGNLQEFKTFNLKTSYNWENSVGLVVGKTTDGDSIGVCPTIYTETYIPQKQIYRTWQNQELDLDNLGENTKSVVSEIEAIISEFGAISLQGGDIDNYNCDHDYRIVYAAGKTKKSAVEKVLQSTGILEVSQFHSFYPDKQYFQEWQFVDEPDEQELMHQKYTQINQFFNQTFSNVMMYRFSFWKLENIYIIGETQSSDWIGIHINSDFVYNP
ncbi:hypothetical protein NIES267_05600 [Calothrix parasitica NIES-267]|uniref:Uncharacterized protein n=1 Tax=Calothrix parasitica NIES-267 TaxID=1973488 RepID=A0A1Z4LIN2_9CYAN|nr:hypothetical protein NIES267_05600 [Calothrix parasitica NIES-267]